MCPTNRETESSDVLASFQKSRNLSSSLSTEGTTVTGEVPHGEIKHNNIILQRHISLEQLNPVHECESRRTSIMVAVINLVATTCGGGVLSLPLAFCRAGIIPTTIFMIYGLFANDFTLYILVSCARRTGGRSYGDVAKSAFGSAAQVGTTALLGLFLLGALTAYLVLVKDVCVPVVLSILPLNIKAPLIVREASVNEGVFDPGMKASETGAATILLLIVLIGSPLLLKHDLHALRYTSYVGFLSCTTLMIAIVYRAHEAVTSNDPSRAPINWYSTNLSDYTFAFPIVILCYMCSFNVLGIHSSLLDPTRKRVKRVLDYSMICCFCLFYMVGLGGYLYALDDTKDNILLNFPMHDSAILLGRLGFCFTLLFGLPLVTLPCREAFRAIPSQMKEWRLDTELVKEFRQVDQRRQEGAHLIINGVDFDKSERFSVMDEPAYQHVTMLKYGSTRCDDHIPGFGNCEGSNSTDDIETQESFDEEPTKEPREFDMERLAHFGTTLAVVSLCYLFAISVPGVGFVWSLAGSSMALVISFIVPTSCYLKIREHKLLNPRSVFAWVLLVANSIATPICTMHAIRSA